MTVQAILSAALLAGLVAVAATVAIERLGGHVGGLVATLPSTIIPACLGFWWTAADETGFADALHAVPAGMLVNVAFLYCWWLIPQWSRRRGASPRVTMVTLLSLLVWAFLALLLVWALPKLPGSLAAVGWSLFIFQLATGAASCWTPPPAPKGSQRASFSVLLARGLLAAAAVAASVWIASRGQPILAGMAAVFPAIFLTTMVSVWLTQGESVPAGAVGPMMLGSSSVSAFALLARWTLPELGPALGITLAWVVAVSSLSVPAWFYLRWRRATQV